ncbi:hypothetical protein EIQ19_07730 [Xanthomonas campestris pv. campestris]|uniref:hypothetical protein n=1 Tax=Xanthomonas campestris TaxID=339 RepID=UPI0005931F3A|nr:hypothetical protein [Xanthomonas campestris]MEA0759845.1 hypothetical protein [Xanthomonas campestris pv. campestris]WDJ15573.1 hypothetical protein JH272_07705 [Xanthomonas campestris pv. campestris]WVJ85624.1 hypothetical protein VDP59_007280 [Xanthomonas campestris pv. campestris]WVL66243.1 hypothetical protein VDQ57_007230 [Xanthomonas campestris pv. campestris]
MGAVFQKPAVGVVERAGLRGRRGLTEVNGLAGGRDVFALSCVGHHQARAEEIDVACPRSAAIARSLCTPTLRSSLLAQTQTALAASMPNASAADGYLTTRWSTNDHTPACAANGIRC